MPIDPLLIDDTAVGLGRAIARHGLAVPSLRQVAAEMNTSHAALLYHFESRARHDMAALRARLALAEIGRTDKAIAAAVEATRIQEEERFATCCRGRVGRWPRTTRGWRS